jgi:hypothetical protein
MRERRAENKELRLTPARSRAVAGGGFPALRDITKARNTAIKAPPKAHRATGDTGPVRENPAVIARAAPRAAPEEAPIT